MAHFDHLEGRTAIITGASAGIGTASAEALADSGANGSVIPHFEGRRVPALHKM